MIWSIGNHAPQLLLELRVFVCSDKGVDIIGRPICSDSKCSFCVDSARKTDGCGTGRIDNADG